MGLSSLARNSFMLQHLLVPILFRFDGQNGRSTAFKQYEPRALKMDKRKNKHASFNWMNIENVCMCRCVQGITFLEYSCPVKWYRLNR